MDDSEVVKAVERLKEVSQQPNEAPFVRLNALRGLALCQWSRHRHEDAIEAIAEIAAIGTENRIRTPAFAFFPLAKGDETIVELGPGAYGLVVPAGKGPNFIVKTTSAVFERRPELAQYSSLLKATPKRHKRRERTSPHRR